MHQLAAHQVHLNAALPWDIYDAAGQLLFSKGSVVERDAQIKSMLDHGMFVKEEDYEQFKHLFPDQRQLKPITEEKFRRIDPFVLAEEIVARLGPLLRNIHQENEFERKILELASLVELLSERHPDAALAAMIMFEKSKYPVVHSLDVALLCAMVTRRLEWPNDLRVSVLCAALTMNIAMLELQGVLTRQRINPTPDQNRIIQEHPTRGVAMLTKAGVTDAIWLRAILEHHELPTGGGYPNGIDNMCKEALLLRTTDVFSAMLAHRVSRKALEVNEAARTCFIEEGKNKNDLTGVLFKEIGVYPPGTFVKLASGETAVVAKRGAIFNAPLAFGLINSKGERYIQPIRRDTAQSEYKITEVVPRQKVVIGLDLRKIWTSSPLL